MYIAPPVAFPLSSPAIMMIDVSAAMGGHQLMALIEPWFLSMRFLSMANQKPAWGMMTRNVGVL